MHIAVPPGSPWWAYAAADTALALHIGCGMTGLASGAAAAIARKGGRLHAKAGKLFVASMLVTASAGAVAAPILPQRISIAAGAFTAYLVLSAWITVRRKPANAKLIERATMLVGVVALIICAWLIWLGNQDADGTIDGQDYHPVIVFAVLAGLGLLLDLRVVRRGGLSGVARVARHLWRMCLALFVASVSFFLGQPQVFPGWLLQSNALLVPALAPLVLLAVWMLRVHTGRRWCGGVVAR